MRKIGNKQSITTTNTSDKTNKNNIQLKDILLHRRINTQITENIQLIWLDNNIDENSVGYRNKMSQFRSIVNTINTFIDNEECIQFIKNIIDQIIISDSIKQNIVSHIHSISHVDSIFILSNKKIR